MNRVTVLYFARAREVAGVSEEVFGVKNGVRFLTDLAVKQLNLLPAHSITYTKILMQGQAQHSCSA